MLEPHAFPRLTVAQSRSITAENPPGERGEGGRATTGVGAEASRELGLGWKVSPAIALQPGAPVTIADIVGEGVVTHMWLTCAPEYWRSLILRMYWDNEDYPSVEVPLGDFFACGWCERAFVNSAAIASLAGGGLNSYWPMPFRRAARITIENRSYQELPQLFYQIDYSLEAVEADVGYLHAQWRRSNPVEDGVHTAVDRVTGWGHYVGTYLAWQTNNNGWWGEGEVKFLDPVRFSQDIRVEVQALGWRSGGRYLPLLDDVASVAVWYQSEPHQPFLPLASANHCEVV